MKRKSLIFISLFLILLSSLMCSVTIMDAKETVKPFDVNRYLGKWYEIARFDVSFERGLTEVVAEYEMMEDGTIKVYNSGTTPEGKRKTSVGKAKIPDLSNPSRLKVSFFWIFYSDYLVLDLDQENYSYALVGSKSDKYLWILSRENYLPEDTLNSILNKAKELGYDITKLHYTRQNGSL